MTNKSGQVTIFIIIAVVLIAGVAGFFLLKDKISFERLPASMEPIHTSFLSCLEEDTLVGIDVLESQGGYGELPDFEPGSSYMPFSSQLNFLGNQIPYWYYVSGNNVQKEQVPSKGDMELALEEFIEEQISTCIFDSYYEQGFEIIQGEPEADVVIKGSEVRVDLDMDFGINKGEESASVRSHQVAVQSELGNLYDSAKRIYKYEQQNLFLENYAVDTLRLYAPVDGVQLNCSPVIWNADEVFNGLEEAIESNTLALKVKGGDYSLKKEENKYFIVDVSVDEDVRFINSRNWTNGFEVSPSEGPVLLAKPMGNQAGLGMMGFCYVPYHFVYDVKYPVLIQVSSGDEIFQFPVAVVLKGNRPREAMDSAAVSSQTIELCEYRNTLVNVQAYDTSLNPIEAEISYECFGARCEIGTTPLSEEFPQCINGYVLARADGFRDAKQLYSVSGGGSIDLIMDRLYEKNINLKLNGKAYTGDAIISFVSDKDSKTVIYPGQKTVELGEGQYEIQVYIYRSSSLRLDKTVSEQCVDVPESGIGGLIGLSHEKCFEVEIPAQIISNALAGGGQQNYYILESELTGSGSIEINAESLPTPSSLEDLQKNYLLFEEKDLDVRFT